MIASWGNMDHDEKTPDLKFVGSRPLEIDEEEWSTFLRIAKAGQTEIERQLNNFNEEDY